MSDVNKTPEGSCPHCSPAPAEEPCCTPAEGSTGCGCRHKQRTEEAYKHLITCVAEDLKNGGEEKLQEFLWILNKLV